MIKQSWKCTWRPRLSKFRDALSGSDGVSFEMHLEAIIQWVKRWTWRPTSSELRDALGGCDCVHVEMHLEVIIERVGRFTWCPWSGVLKDALGVQHRVNAKIHSEAMIERFWWCPWRPRSNEIQQSLRGGRYEGGSSRGRWDGSQDYELLHMTHSNVASREQQGVPRVERWETGWEWQTIEWWFNVVLGVYYT